ncbi:DegV family protein [Lactococcus cremoris]|uniref:DegV family protein n=1 Tax=Lactococcus lactis subsp. cremoris TaxID=1359 RepID=UPI0021A9FC06|nr:DegV family protein [Lactococcus cremoris]MCT4430879.1 DegV family protein [Lactococcus cremoris]
MKLAVITDSSADFAEKYKTYQNLFVLDIPISIDGVDYDLQKISHEEWYDLMAKAQEVPKTSQPSVAELDSLLKDLEKQGYTHVLGLFLPAVISGFYQNIFYLQSEYEQMKVLFPETFITSSPLGYMVETVLDLAEAGAESDEIIAKFEEQREGDRAYMLVDDLHWLAKGGRLSNGAAVLGTLLNIKPVLTFSTEGKVEVFEKVRTVKKTMSRMKELLLKEVQEPSDYKVYVIQTRAEERAQELYDFALSQGFDDVEIVTFGPVIATHLGLNTVAYGISPKK